MSFFDELTADERRALDSIDLTPILGTPRERMQLVLHKAMEYMRQARIAKANERVAWHECEQQKAIAANAMGVLRFVLNTPGLSRDAEQAITKFIGPWEPKS